MFTALTIDNQKIEARANAICFCDNCGHRVYPKCVHEDKIYLMRKHFAHPKGVICDNWYEPISEWHHEWQSYVPIEQREVSIEHGTIRHIADIFLNVPNVIVELQKSHIPFDVKKKRDSFYNRIIWVVHPNLKRASWVIDSNTPIFIDLLDGNIQTPKNTKITKDEFINSILLNPNFKYEEWIFGFDGEYIHTKTGKKTIADIIPGEHLVFLMDTRFVSQCLLCNNPQWQIQDISELIYVSDIPLFICKHCGKMYSAYLVKNDPRGDDLSSEIRREFKKIDSLLGQSLVRFWITHKKTKGTPAGRGIPW